MTVKILKLGNLIPQIYQLNNMNKFFNNIFGSRTFVNHGVGNNVTQITGNRSGTCTINGKTFKGNNISIIDGVVYVDGKAADESNASINTTIIVKITGNVDSISTASGDVEVTGHAGKISTGSGNVSTGGGCAGAIFTSSGDVDINGQVCGSVKTKSGNIRYRQ